MSYRPDLVSDVTDWNILHTEAIIRMLTEEDVDILSLAQECLNNLKKIKCMIESLSPDEIKLLLIKYEKRCKKNRENSNKSTASNDDPI